MTGSPPKHVFDDGFTTKSFVWGRVHPKITFVLTVSPKSHFVGDGFTQSHFFGDGFERISGTNGVAVARHGLILGQDGATGSREVSGYLRGLRDTI